MRFTKHAAEQMFLRGIPQSDAEVVYSWPSDTTQGRKGARNFYGQGPVSGYRIRVTVSAQGIVKTVAWADWRKSEVQQ